MLSELPAQTLPAGLFWEPAPELPNAGWTCAAIWLDINVTDSAPPFSPST